MFPSVQKETMHWDEFPFYSDLQLYPWCLQRPEQSMVKPMENLFSVAQGSTPKL